MNIDSKQLQQALLAANDHERAAMVSDPLTEITVYPTVFLKQYQIYRVFYFNPYKPILLYLGFASNLPIYSLVGNPEAYINLAKADQVDIATPEVAINYATVFLEVTRSMSELVYAVNSVDQLKFRRRLTTEQLHAQEVLFEKYRSIIAPPTAEAVDGGYMVIAYVVRQQELQCQSLKISRKGVIESHTTVLERNMPVVVGL